MWEREEEEKEEEEVVVVVVVFTREFLINVLILQRQMGLML